jgi:hypothetical protein
MPVTAGGPVIGWAPPAPSLVPVKSRKPRAAPKTKRILQLVEACFPNGAWKDVTTAKVISAITARARRTDPDAVFHYPTVHHALGRQ